MHPGRYRARLAGLEGHRPAADHWQRGADRGWTQTGLAGGKPDRLPGLVPADHPCPPKGRKRSLPGAARRPERVATRGTAGDLAARPHRRRCRRPVAARALSRAAVARHRTASGAGRRAAAAAKPGAGLTPGHTRGGLRRCAHACPRSSGIAGLHDRHPPPSASGRSRMPPICQWRTPPAVARGAGPALSSRTAR